MDSLLLLLLILHTILCAHARSNSCCQNFGSSRNGIATLLSFRETARFPSRRVPDGLPGQAPTGTEGQAGSAARTSLQPNFIVEIHTSPAPKPLVTLVAHIRALQ